MSLSDALLPAPHSFEVWIATRTDGVMGSGTPNDAYDGSTAEKLDDILANHGAANMRIHFGPGTFQINGFPHDATSSWLKPGMKIVGAGIDVTTLQMVGGDTAGKHYFAIGHPLSSGGQPNLIDYFEVSDLTIDCNFAAQSGSSVAAGAVRVLGNHARVRRVKVTGWGTKSGGPDCYVIAVLTADPSSGVKGVTNSGIEGCIAVNPGSGDVGPTIVLHAGPAGDFGATEEGYGTGPFIRNCFVDSDPSTAEVRGLSMAWCKGGVVEGNQIHNTTVGGPYSNQSSARDLVVRNNFYKNVGTGPFWDLGTLASSYGTGSIARSGSVATVMVTAGHGLSVGDRVKIVASPSAFDGVHRVTAVSGNTFSFTTPNSGVASALLSSAQKVFGLGKLVVEGNTVEIVGNSGQPAIYVHDNGLSSQAPDYAHGDMIIRGNRIRYVDGAFDVSYTGYGIQVNGAKNLLVQNNVVEAVPHNPIRNNHCGSVKYFNNKAPGGVLIQGINEDNHDKKYDELETEAEDAFVLALFNRK